MSPEEGREPAAERTAVPGDDLTTAVTGAITDATQRRPDEDHERPEGRQ